MSKVSDFKNQVKERFPNVVEGSIHSRLSTGSFDVDRAYCGALARGRFHLWLGKESSCKTTLAMHTMKEANRINWETGQFDLTLKKPSPTLFVDIEGTFDLQWAEKIGIDPDSFDDYNYLVKPTTGEEAVDIVLNAIEAETFALIVVDSNEAFVSAKTVEISASDAVVADRARLLARMYRVGQSNMIGALNKTDPWKTPTVVCLNQLRETIGGFSGGFSTPMHAPGGRAQNHYSSSIMRFNAPIVIDDNAKMHGMGEFKGFMQKNKTGTPKKHFKFQMALRDLRNDDGTGLAAGQIDNAANILRDLKEYDLMEKSKEGWVILGETYRVQSDFKDKLRGDVAFQRRVWNQLLQLHQS